MQGLERLEKCICMQICTFLPSMCQVLFNFKINFNKVMYFIDMIKLISLVQNMLKEERLIFSDFVIPSVYSLLTDYKKDHAPLYYLCLIKRKC